MIALRGEAEMGTGGGEEGRRGMGGSVMRNGVPVTLLDYTSIYLCTV